jgi:peptidoglycan-associated lipoprotein
MNRKLGGAAHGWTGARNSTTPPKENLMRKIIPVLLLAAAACATAKKETPVAEAPPPAPVIQAAAPKAPPPVIPAARACQGDADCTSSQLCLQSRCEAITSTTAACDAISTHFEFDSSTVRSDDFTALQRAARCLQARPATKVRIEGNCDARGTTAYNVALGQRRAAASQKYLIDLGVPANRTSTVSYGKEKPRCTEETEACWATNRRDDLLNPSVSLAAIERQ